MPRWTTEQQEAIEKEGKITSKRATELGFHRIHLTFLFSLFFPLNHWFFPTLVTSNPFLKNIYPLI